MMIEEPDFKGYIHDVGGPTANFRAPACEKQMTKGVCPQQAVPVPGTMQESERQIISDYIALLTKTAGIAESKEGVYPVRHPI